MSQRHLAVPEDDLKSYCKTADSATLQYPSDWPEDGLKPYWVKIPNRGNHPTPEDDLKPPWVNQRIPPRYPPPRMT